MFPIPPKAKITKDMIIDAAFEIARTEGAENINARTIAQKLSCSTQPVMYHFAKVDDIRKAVYAKADAYHAQYLMDVEENCDDPMLRIGLQYIRFAVHEKHLFRFLFQSNEFSDKNLMDLVNAEELEPVFAVMQQAMETGREEVKEIFLHLFLFAHGYASMFANNAMEYDEAVITLHLEKAFIGAVCASKEVK